MERHPVRVGGETITISLTVQFDVPYWEDRSGMTTEQLVLAVNNAVRAERDALVTEAKIAAIRLLDGEPLED